MTEERDETEIDLLQLAKALIKKWWIIAIASIVAAALALGYTYIFVTPKYQSSASFYVNSKNLDIGGVTASISSGEINAARSLVSVYIEILKSRTALNEVIRDTGVEYKYSELLKMISAASVNNTEIFKVTVTSHDPKEAELIVNQIAQKMPQWISDIVDGTSVRVVDYGIVPERRSSPSYSKNTILGFLIGFIGSSAVIIIMDLFDDVVHSEEYLTQTYSDIPLLAVIPDLDAHNGGGYGYGYGYGYGEQPKTSQNGKGGNK